MYTESDSKIGKCQGGALILGQAKPAPKQLNLTSLAMQADPKSSDCPTPAEPIFQSRAVYGLTLSDIPLVETPSPVKKNWGTLIPCTYSPLYSLERLDVTGAIPLHYYLKRRGTYFVEEGDLAIRSLLPDGTSQWERVRAGQLFSVQEGDLHAFYPLHLTKMYFFTNGGRFEDARFAETNTLPPLLHPLPFSKRESFDRREKYWGSIESIVNECFAGKRMTLRKGGQSSLEFHCHKTETYYLHSGILKVGLRVGRAENTSVVLLAGQSFTIPPGLMHMRIALEESVLIEISTADSDKDSHLIEDGRTYQHKEIT